MQSSLSILAVLIVVAVYVYYCDASSDRCAKWDWVERIKPRPFRPRNSKCRGMDTGARFPNAVRKKILAYHNGIRAQLVNGCAMTKDGALPTSNNMRLLTYNCTLEKQAQAWANTCPTTHSPFSKYAGENLWYVNGGYRVNTTDPFKNAIKSFWHELIENGHLMLERGDTKFVNITKIGHYTQQIWAKTNSVGCGFKECHSGKNPNHGHGYSIICQYYPSGNINNYYVYEKGARCEKDSDCLNDVYNKCVKKSGLCTTGKPKRKGKGKNRFMKH